MRSRVASRVHVLHAPIANQCHETGMAKTTGCFFLFVAMMATRADAHGKADEQEQNERGRLSWVRTGVDRNGQEKTRDQGKYMASLVGV